MEAKVMPAKAAARPALWTLLDKALYRVVRELRTIRHLKHIDCVVS